MSSLKSNSSGFTILELLVATMIFSIILLLCAFGLVQIGKTYYRGITSSRTQAVARAATEDVVQSLQYGGGDVEETPLPVTNSRPIAPKEITIGNKMYTYTLGMVLSPKAAAGSIKETKVGLQVVTLKADGTADETTRRELLGSGMWLSEFTIKQKPTTSIYQVKVTVVHGDLDLVEDKNGKLPDVDASTFDYPSTKCRIGAGNQFCAVSGLYTEAVRRL